MRALLRYLCEKEISGEAESITEYLIGVEALGLPDDFSPGEDSTVRNRAYTLRKKLSELYSGPLADAPLQIEFPKGSYIPQFVAAGEVRRSAAAATPAAAPALETTVQALVMEPRRTIAERHPWKLAAASACLALALSLGGWLWWRQAEVPQRSHRVDPLIAEAWGPLLAPNANVLVGVATSIQLAMRPSVAHGSTGSLEPASAAVNTWYRRFRPLDSSARLHLFGTQNSVGLGDAIAATTAVKLLAEAGSSFQAMADRLVPYAATRQRNAMFVGLPADSEAIARGLASLPLRVEPAGTQGDFVIVDHNAGGRTFASTRQGDRLTAVYGLLTVMPSAGSLGKQRTVLISRTHSAGAQAAIEFFVSPESLRELQAAMKRPNFPVAYQVVVRASTDSTLPLSFAYAHHAIITE